ncbi:MAG: hypothetical protein ACKPKO_02330, partial [Candidatus Fonsibacter sp.]
ELRFHVNSNATARMVLNDTSLTVAGDMKANNFVANVSSLSLKRRSYTNKSGKSYEHARTDTN